MVRQKAFEVIQDPEFKKQNFSQADHLRVIFKANVNYLLQYKNIPVRTFFRSLNTAGVSITMNAWIYSQRTSPPSFLLVVTFARILGVTPSQLLDPDLPSYYGESQEP